MSPSLTQIVCPISTSLADVIEAHRGTHGLKTRSAWLKRALEDFADWWEGGRDGELGWAPLANPVTETTRYKTRVAHALKERLGAIAEHHGVSNVSIYYSAAARWVHEAGLEVDPPAPSDDFTPHNIDLTLEAPAITHVVIPARHRDRLDALVQDARRDRDREPFYAEAARRWLDQRKRHDGPWPYPYRAMPAEEPGRADKVALNIPRPLHAEISRRAGDDGMTLTTLYFNAIMDALTLEDDPREALTFLTRPHVARALDRAGAREQIDLDALHRRALIAFPDWYEARGEEARWEWEPWAAPRAGEVVELALDDELAPAVAALDALAITYDVPREAMYYSATRQWALTQQLELCPPSIHALALDAQAIGVLDDAIAHAGGDAMTREDFVLAALEQWLPHRDAYDEPWPYPYRANPAPHDAARLELALTPSLYRKLEDLAREDNHTLDDICYTALVEHLRRR